MNYIDAIHRGYPEYFVYSTGPLYEDINWQNQEPISKELLDTILLELEKEVRIEEVNVLRELQLLQGVWFEDNLYDCDARGRTNINGAVTSLLIGQTLPPNFSWRTKVNTNVIMNADSVKGLGLAMMTYVAFIYEWSWNVKAMITALTTVDAVRDFIIEWPTNNFDGTGPGLSTSASAYVLMMQEG